MTNEIINDLKGENNVAFGQLYKKYFGMVHRFITNNNGQSKDAEDIFQDTMLILVEKLRNDNFQLTASIKTYIMAIAKNLWFKRLRSPYQEIAFDESTPKNKFYANVDNAIEAEKSYRDKLQNYLHRITKHCKGLIHKMFFQGQAIEQIQQEYGYTSKHNAQNQKHKCIEQIRKIKAQEEKKQH